MKKTALELHDLIDEIDVECDKVLAIVNNLLNKYVVHESVEPSTQFLKSGCLDSGKEIGKNTFNFVNGYHETITFIHIVLDYVYNISQMAKKANV